MKKFNTILLASALVLSVGTAVAPAMARTAVSIDFGNIALGYRDGYYDNDHHYHRWDRRNADAYRSRYHDNYRDMSHGRDHHRPWNR